MTIPMLPKLVPKRWRQSHQMVCLEFYLTYELPPNCSIVAFINGTKISIRVLEIIEDDVVRRDAYEYEVLRPLRFPVRRLKINGLNFGIYMEKIEADMWPRLSDNNAMTDFSYY